MRFRTPPINHQPAVHHTKRNARLLEQRIKRMEKRIASGKGSGWYDRALLLAGLHQDDVEEYGDRYTGRQARTQDPAGSLSAPCGKDALPADRHLSIT
jgi:hypothetical protein